jgi:hypothetical protein
MESRSSFTMCLKKGSSFTKAVPLNRKNYDAGYPLSLSLSLSLGLFSDLPGTGHSVPGIVPALFKSVKKLYGKLGMILR